MTKRNFRLKNVKKMVSVYLRELFPILKTEVEKYFMSEWVFLFIYYCAFRRLHNFFVARHFLGMFLPRSRIFRSPDAHQRHQDSIHPFILRSYTTQEVQNKDNWPTTRSVWINEWIHTGCKTINDQTNLYRWMNILINSQLIVNQLLFNWKNKLQIHFSVSGKNRSLSLVLIVI